MAFASFADAVAGGCGGFFSSVVLFPLDVLKTKAQSGNAKENRSALALAAKVFREEGIFGFFRGCQWRGFQSFCEKCGYFYCYTLLRSQYRTIFKVEAGLLIGFVLGYLGEWMHAPLTMPIDTMVVRMITQKRTMGSIIAEVAKRPLDAYKGASVFIVANTKVALQFAVYEQVKRLLVNTSGQISGRNAFVGGALSRLVADTVLFPTRRIKVHRQSYKAQVERGEITAEQAEQIGKMGNFALLRQIAREGGVAAIFNGLQLELLRGIISGAVMLSIKESMTLGIKIFLFTRFGYLEQANALRALR
jgi:hypothetical protein